MTRPLVDLRDVTVIAGGRTLLSRVTVSVRPGEALRLHGSNGGGKTTLLRLLSGEVAPVSGTRVYGLGGGVQRSAVRARRTLSVVGPDAEAFYLTREWAQTARDVLLAGHDGEALNLWDANPAALARLAEVAALTGVEALLDRDFRTLSHGQRRRVLLARALMPSPDLLLLDEFTDGLSPAARRDLGAVLRAVQAQGVAVVLATHRPEEAPELPWRTLHVQEGHVTEAPPTPSTSHRPQATSLHSPLPTSHFPSAPFVCLENVTVYRNGHRALGPLNWTWESGQHWLVTGENGSGKSTLVRLIAGELHAAQGGCVARPYLARDLQSTRRRSIGLLSAEVGIRQRRAETGGWTGREVLASAWHGTEGLAEALTPEQAAHLDELAGTLHLTELLERSTEGLSQGQLRRLLLGRAVLHRPRLLLLDEGLDFLDAAARARFLALLPELTAAGTHLLVVAHRESDAPAGLTHHLHLESGQVSGQWTLGPGRGTLKLGL